MTNPFAWMVGQIQEAIAHQEPSGSVALPPGLRSVATCIRECELKGNVYRDFVNLEPSDYERLIKACAKAAGV